MPRERQLPFGVAAGVEFGPPCRLGERYFAVKMRDEMPHAMGAHERQRRVEAALAKRCGLLRRAGL